MEEERATAVSLFTAITGVEDIDIIRAFLEDAAWNVEVAVSNYEGIQRDE